MKRRYATMLSGVWLFLAGATPLAQAQSADWQTVVWREPQVRHLLADMSLGGNVSMYRDYATREKDPDSRDNVDVFLKPA